MEEGRERVPVSKETREIAVSETRKDIGRSMREALGLMNTREGRRRIKENPIEVLAEITGVRDHRLLNEVFQGARRGIEDFLQGTVQEDLPEPVYFGLGLPFWPFKRRAPKQELSQEQRALRRLLLAFMVSAGAGIVVAIGRERSTLFKRVAKSLHRPTEEETTTAAIGGPVYEKYMAGKMAGVHPFQIRDPEVRALVGFGPYGKGSWFGDQLSEFGKEKLEAWFGRKFTDAELLAWRDDPETYLIPHLQKMCERGEMSQEAWEFYNKPLEQIQAEYMAEYSSQPVQQPGKVRQSPLARSITRRIKTGEELRRKERLSRESRPSIRARLRSGLKPGEEK